MLDRDCQLEISRRADQPLRFWKSCCEAWLLAVTLTGSSGLTLFEVCSGPFPWIATVKSVDRLADGEVRTEAAIAMVAIVKA